MTGYGFSIKAKRQPHKFCVAAFFDVRLTTRSGFLRVLLWHLNIPKKMEGAGAFWALSFQSQEVLATRLLQNVAIFL